MNPIRILVVDDHALVRQGICRLLEDEAGLEVVGEAADGQEAVAAVAGARPDVILMDIAMPRLSGLDATAEIKRQYPEVQVLLLTVHDDEEYLFRALEVGAAGYLLKEAEVTELVIAIQAAARGEVYLQPAIARRLVRDYLRRVREGALEEAAQLDQLTERQQEVLRLVAEGLTDREIAGRLVISPYTVQTHRQNIMHKLGLHNRTELVKYAIRHGLIDLDGPA